MGDPNGLVGPKSIAPGRRTDETVKRRSRQESRDSMALDDYEMQMNPRQKAVLDRIKILEEAVTKGREYLESEAHADWHGFRPRFDTKMRDGKALPPHKDWVKNVFLPSRERALSEAERLLERLTLEEQKKQL